MGGKPSSTTLEAALYDRRKAEKAGSWYEKNPVRLRKELRKNLENVEKEQGSTRVSDDSLRAVIVPHAGFSYSGPTAAFSYYTIYRELQSSRIQKIVVLHPSHHFYLKGCAVSGASYLATPVGDLPVDKVLREEILSLKFSSGKLAFSVMTKQIDEDEHSGEMQYPFLATILADHPGITVTPIMCGSISTSMEEVYGKLLHPILSRPEVCTVISSDFCHWGKRFSYQPTGDRGIPIHEFIRQLDHRGMDLIRLAQPGAFADYLKETRNTICGRHAIGVWLQSVVAGSDNREMHIEFLKYAQSSAVMSEAESSVSYAAAAARLKS